MLQHKNKAETLTSNFMKLILEFHRQYPEETKLLRGK